MSLFISTIVQHLARRCNIKLIRSNSSRLRHCLILICLATRLCLDNAKMYVKCAFIWHWHWEHCSYCLKQGVILAVPSTGPGNPMPSCALRGTTAQPGQATPPWVKPPNDLTRPPRTRGAAHSSTQTPKNDTDLRRTLISFSRESSLPLSAFLSMILMATMRDGSSFTSARRTWEKAPLSKGKAGRQYEDNHWLSTENWYLCRKG